MIGVERVKNLKICFPAAADVGGDDGGIQDLLPRVQIAIRAVDRSQCCWVIIDISPNRDVAQTCALPPSTNSSIPVTKLESSEARYSAALATSSGFPMRPMGMVDTMRAITSADCRLTSGVLIGPGLTTFERI